MVSDQNTIIRILKKLTSLTKRVNPNINVVILGYILRTQNVKFDKCFFGSYSKHLMVWYRGYVNVKYCNKPNSIMYLFKYVKKGHTRETMYVSNDGENHDIFNHVDDIIK